MSNVMLNVKSNVKGRVEHTFDSPYVVITGHNGAGKSAIVHSIELACCGQVLDAGGRDSKIKAHLELLAKGDDLFALVAGTEGLDYEWGSKHSPKLRNAVKDALDAVTGSPAGLYRFVLSHWCTKGSYKPEVDAPGFESLVSRYGFHKALLRLDGNIQKSLRQHRTKLKELDIVQSYVHVEGGDFEENRAQVLEQIEAARVLGQEISGHIENVVRHETENLCMAMNRWMPDIDYGDVVRPEFHLVGDDLRLGLYGRPVPSGAETVFLAIALAATVFKPEECIYIVPDRDYDPITFWAIMLQLRSIPCFGAVVTNTANIDCSFGWHRVEL